VVVLDAVTVLGIYQFVSAGRRWGLTRRDIAVDSWIP
jgi:hypothetical protein